MATKFFKHNDIVKELLTNRPACRDSNEKLLASVYERYVRLYNKTGMNPINSAFDLIQAMAFRKDFPKAESITRASRLLQEKHPELRGELWEERRTKRQEEVKSEIRDFHDTSPKDEATQALIDKYGQGTMF